MQLYVRFDIMIFLIVILTMTARGQEDDFYLPDKTLILDIRTAQVQYKLVRHRIEEHNAR